MLPVSISYSRMPAEYTSERASALPSVTSSGARYDTVPIRRPWVAVLPVALTARARPKSATFTVPLSDISTFSGLMSRCTMPASWAAESADRIGASRSSARAGESGACVADHVPQRATGNVLHRQEQGPVVVTLVEDGHHVRVREAGGGPGLGHEPAGELGVVAEPVVHHLERDGPVQPHVESLVDSGHAALGDARADAVPSVEHPPDKAVADLRPHVVRHLR